MLARYAYLLKYMQCILSFLLKFLSALTEAAYAIVVGEEEKIRTYDLNCKGEVGF